MGYVKQITIITLLLANLSHSDPQQAIKPRDITMIAVVVMLLGFSLGTQLGETYHK